MLFSEIGPNTLNRELNSFLEGSKLSLSQVAKRLGVSKGHLSEIKNGKATPALNTGLRILKLCGLEIEQRRAWAHFYNTSISEEYLEVHDDWEKENDRKLNEKASALLARDLDLMNAYIDIVNSEEQGLALVELRVEYGRSIESKLQKLHLQGVVEVEKSDLGKVYKTGKVDPIITRHASYDLINNVVSDQQMQYQAGENKGKFKFHINDVDQEGYQKLSELLQVTMKEAEKIMVDHKLARTKGGERFAFEMLLGQLKSFILLAFLGFGFMLSGVQDSYAQGGGLSGGSSDDQIIRDLEIISWPELIGRKDLILKFPTVNIRGENISLEMVCHDKENNTLMTTREIEICHKTKLIKEFCVYNANQELKCTATDEYNEDESYYRYDESVGTTVLKRVCTETVERRLMTAIYRHGFMLNFNLKGEAPRSEHFRYLYETQEGDFKVSIPVSQKLESNEQERIAPIGTKNYQIPLCL